MNSPSKNHNTSNSTTTTLQSPPITTKVTEEYKFAGQTITVSKEIPISSPTSHTKGISNSNNVSPIGKKAASPGRQGGLDSLLSSIGKKKTLSVIDKSQMDWNDFKKKQNITEELESHKKSSSSYLDKVSFLHRADLKQYEFEQSLKRRKKD